MIDEDSDGLINFKEFSLLCSLISRGDLQERLKLLYKMHLSSLDDVNSADSCSPQKELFDVVENAMEATEDSEEDKLSKEDTLVVVPSNVGVEGKLEDEEEIIMTPTSETLEENIWPQNMRDPADMKESNSAKSSFSSDEKGIIEDPNTDLYNPPSMPNNEEETATDVLASEAIKVASEQEASPRSLSPHTTEYILSKSPKSAKKLVKDFVASVMKDENKTEELPYMTQVIRTLVFVSVFSYNCLITRCLLADS